MTFNVNITVRRRREPIAVAPGRNRAALINAAIAEAAILAAANGESYSVYLDAGRYELESPIVGKSGVILSGVGDRTMLRPTYTGGADDVANHVIGADGTIDTATLNTSLSAQCVKRASSVVVASAGAVAAGSYILIQGNNGAEDALLESTAIILSEVVKVAATYASGLTLPLAWPARQHHGTGVVGVTVRGVIPIVGFEVHDLQIEGSSSVITAVGVFARYALNITVRNVSASGLSRAAIECVGVKGFRSSGFRSHGTNNNWYHLISVCDADVSDFRGDDGVARVHASGTPRYPFLVRSRCTNVVIHDGTLNGVSSGMYLVGGEHVTFRGITVRDVVMTQAIFDRMVAGGELQDGPVVLGWGSGFGPLAFAEYAFDVVVSDLRIEDIEAPNAAPWTDTPYRARALYFHDALRFQASNVACVNRGSESQCSGLVLSDVAGHVSSVLICGYSYGLVTENVATQMQIDGFLWSGVRGNSPNASYPVYLNHHGSNGHRLHVNGFRHYNGFSGARFGTSFLADFDIDAGVLFTDMATDDGTWDRVVVAYNATGTSFAVGDIVEIDPTHTGAQFRVRTPDTGIANYERRLAVVAGGTPNDPGTGYVLVALLPQSTAVVMATAAAVNFGDSMKYVATRRAVTDNTLDGSPRLGVSLTRKAAGAEGLISIKPVAG